MPWKCSILAEHPILETTYSETLTPPELEAAIGETLAMAESTNTTLLLGNCLDLVGGHSITDLYFFVDTVADHPAISTIKEALLLPSLSASSDMVEFWETACLNRGIRVRLFHDRQSALDWLLE